MRPRTRSPSISSQRREAPPGERCRGFYTFPGPLMRPKWRRRSPSRPKLHLGTQTSYHGEDMESTSVDGSRHSTGSADPPVTAKLSMESNTSKLSSRPSTSSGTRPALAKKSVVSTRTAQSLSRPSSSTTSRRAVPMMGNESYNTGISRPSSSASQRPAQAKTSNESCLRSNASSRTCSSTGSRPAQTKVSTDSTRTKKPSSQSSTRSDNLPPVPTDKPDTDHHVKKRKKRKRSKFEDGGGRPSRSPSPTAFDKATAASSGTMKTKKKSRNGAKNIPEDDLPTKTSKTEKVLKTRKKSRRSHSRSAQAVDKSNVECDVGGKTQLPIKPSKSEKTHDAKLRKKSRVVHLRSPPMMEESIADCDNDGIPELLTKLRKQEKVPKSRKKSRDSCSRSPSAPKKSSAECDSGGKRSSGAIKKRSLRNISKSKVSLQKRRRRRKRSKSGEKVSRQSSYTTSHIQVEKTSTKSRRSCKRRKKRDSGKRTSKKTSSVSDRSTLNLKSPADLASLSALSLLSNAMLLSEETLHVLSPVSSDGVSWGTREFEPQWSNTSLKLISLSKAYLIARPSPVDMHQKSETEMEVESTPLPPPPPRMTVRDFLKQDELPLPPMPDPPPMPSCFNLDDSVPEEKQYFLRFQLYNIVKYLPMPSKIQGYETLQMMKIALDLDDEPNPKDPLSKMKLFLTLRHYKTMTAEEIAEAEEEKKIRDEKVRLKIEALREKEYDRIETILTIVNPDM